MKLERNRWGMWDARRRADRVSGICKHGFTLIEIMIVMAIMGLILATSIPSLYRMSRREGMRQAVNDVMEVCSHARAQAIFSSATVEVVFHPMEGRFEVGGGGAASASHSEDSGDFVVQKPAAPAGSGLAGQFSDDIVIEMLDINLLEYNQSDVARVRFFPNGTSDELTLILRSSKNEWKKITLEVTTGLASVDSVQ